MKNIFAFALIVFMMGIQISTAQSNKAEWIFQPKDQQLVEEKLQAFSSMSNLPIGSLITEIGFSFSGTPYVAATLENGLEEKMIINLRELDCTTFVENCLALVRTVKNGKTDFDSFVNELEKIRYRDGKRNGYPSRLHYFSEWIHNNDSKGFISETVNQKGKIEGRIINFMSTHAGSYPVLKAHPELIAIIAEKEKALSQQGFQYFPKNNPENLKNNIQNGDIIGLTSGVGGLDINHTGIIIGKNNDFYLLHASQNGGKVMLSDEPLSDFLKPGSKNTGVMIARPLF